MFHKEIEVVSQDGSRLSHDLYLNQNQTITHISILLPGLAIKPTYYKKFSEYLTEKNIAAAVVVVNYRGVGLNRDGFLNDRSITLHDWGREDVANVIKWVEETYPNAEIEGIGHSMGGYLFGFTPKIQVLSRIKLFCSPSGRLRDFKTMTGIQYSFFAYVLLPFFKYFFDCARYSYLGLGEDIPIGVVEELTRWSKNSKFMKGELCAEDMHYSTFGGVLDNVHIADDPIAPRKAIEIYSGYYENAERTVVTLDPKIFFLERIGHLGFFRKRHTDDLWNTVFSD